MDKYPHITRHVVLPVKPCVTKCLWSAYYPPHPPFYEIFKSSASGPRAGPLIQGAAPPYSEGGRSFFSFINLTTLDLIPGQRMCKDWSLPTAFIPTAKFINTAPHPFVGPRFLAETALGHDRNFEEDQRDYSLWFTVLHASDSRSWLGFRRGDFSLCFWELSGCRS